MMVAPSQLKCLSRWCTLLMKFSFKDDDDKVWVEIGQEGKVFYFAGTVSHLLLWLHTLYSPLHISLLTKLYNSPTLKCLQQNVAGLLLTWSNGYANRKEQKKNDEEMKQSLMWKQNTPQQLSWAQSKPVGWSFFSHHHCSDCPCSAHILLATT